MRASTSLVALAVAAIAGFAPPPCHAQQPGQHAPESQPERMKRCDTQASLQKLTGDARRSFMSDCLSRRSTDGSGTSSGNSQQDKTLFCNFQASDRHLTGEARKRFVSDCLNAQ
jgi:psiF repeat-containing protein